MNEKRDSVDIPPILKKWGSWRKINKGFIISSKKR